MGNLNLSLKIISPLHIKSGEDFSIIEGLIHNGFLYLFNIDKIFSSPLRESFINFIDSYEGRNSFDIRDFFNYYRANFDNLLPFVVEKIPIEMADFSERFQAEKISKFIRYFNLKRAVFEPYIPGSSLKGSFKSCLEHFSLYKNSFALSEIAFEDFYFLNLKRKIRKITRLNPLKKRKKITLYVELVEEGEAEGKIYFPAKTTNPSGLKNLVIKAFNLKANYYFEKNKRFEKYFSEEFKKKLQEDSGQYLILPLGFGSRSFEDKRKIGKEYYTLSGEDSYDPIGVVKLTLLSS